jgi:signal transduction histidine kinase
LGLFAVAAVLSWWASDLLLIRPVKAIVHASRKIAAGNLDARAGPVRGHNELSELVHVFDEMAAALRLREMRERASHDALRRSREQLRELASYLQSAREKERSRIAREIHDDFGQSLTILKMDLSWLNKHLPGNEKPFQEKIDTMGQVIDGALRTLHTVSAELRPVILDDFGLAAAIEWQAEEFQNRTGIQCSVEVQPLPEQMPKEISTALFRIFQESMTNVMRHAGAKRVTVNLSVRGGWLILVVADDGRGITEAEINNPRAFGLIGIRERIFPWNGRVEWVGRPGQGTRDRKSVV